MATFEKIGKKVDGQVDGEPLYYQPSYTYEPPLAKKSAENKGVPAVWKRRIGGIKIAIFLPPSAAGKFWGFSPPPKWPISPKIDLHHTTSFTTEGSGARIIPTPDQLRFPGFRTFLIPFCNLLLLVIIFSRNQPHMRNQWVKSWQNTFLTTSSGVFSFWWNEKFSDPKIFAPFGRDSNLIDFRSKFVTKIKF